jgi:hypothetical protein
MVGTSGVSSTTIDGRMMARRRRRVSLQDGLHLNLNLLIEQHFVRPGAARASTIRWTYSGEEVAAGLIAADMRGDVLGSMLLILGDCSQRIVLQRCPRHFGGGQWYFVCPQTGRWASVLWKPPGAQSFACRQTWGQQVAYSSQFQTMYDRACSAARAIRYRLGGPDYSDFAGEPPPRPKGMHWRTYEREIARIEAYENACDSYLLQFIARL